MTDICLGLLGLALIITSIGCYIFAYNAADNIGDAIDSVSCRKSYIVKGVLFGIYTIVCFYIAISIINKINLMLQL